MKAVDNIFEGNVLWNRLRGRTRPWGGGHRHVVTLTVTDRTQGGSFSGFDTLSTTQEDVRQRSTVDPSEYYWPVVFSGIQMAVNKGPEAFLNLVAEEFSDVARALSETLGEHSYLDGTGNSSKNIAGLNYHVDDATDVVTWQGLSRNTYTNLRSTRNAQSGALGFANLATDTDAAQRGSDSPTLIITTPAVFSIIERLVTPTVNVSYGQVLPRGAAVGQEPGAGIQLSYGVNALYWRGIPILADEKCTANNIFTLNENHLYLAQLDYSSEMVDATKEGFAWTGWKKSQNQNAIVGLPQKTNSGVAHIKSSLINLGTSVPTRMFDVWGNVYHTGWYENPQQAASAAVAETEREDS